MNATTPSKTRPDAYELITNKFVEAIEAGTNPFSKPWSSACGGLPRNISKRPYRGINLLLTMLECQEREWTIPIFLTFRQVKERGWKVRKGEKGTHVCYAGTKVPDKYKDDPEKCPPELRYFYRKLYSVFNISQLEGVDLSEYLPKERDFHPIQKAEEVVLGYGDQPPIEHTGSEAYYSPSDDKITMPAHKSFVSDEAYYAVLYHEMAHSTGHKSRLDRDMNGDKKAYAFEELIAELTGSFLCAHVGLEETNFERSAAYLVNWLECLKGDKKFLLQAASIAQKATDYILGSHNA